MTQIFCFINYFFSLNHFFFILGCFPSCWSNEGLLKRKGMERAALISPAFGP